MSVIKQQIKDVEEETELQKSREIKLSNDIIKLQKKESIRNKHLTNSLEELFEEVCNKNFFNGWTIKFTQFPIEKRKFPVLVRVI